MTQHEIRKKMKKRRQNRQHGKKRIKHYEVSQKKRCR